MQNEIDIITPTIFPDEVVAGMTTRNLEQFPGYGFSISPHEDFNNDQALAHQKLLAQQLGFDHANFRLVEQVHGINVVEVTKEINIREKADENFQSYRRDGLKSGRSAVFIARSE